MTSNIWILDTVTLPEITPERFPEFFSGLERLISKTNSVLASKAADLKYFLKKMTELGIDGPLPLFCSPVRTERIHHYCLQELVKTLPEHTLIEDIPERGVPLSLTDLANVIDACRQFAKIDSFDFLTYYYSKADSNQIQATRRFTYGQSGIVTLKSSTGQFLLKIMFPHTENLELSVLQELNAVERIPKILYHGSTESESRRLGFYAMDFFERHHSVDYNLLMWERKLGDILSIVLNLLRTLEAVHQAGYAHNDVSGDNVLLSPYRDNPVLIDFGLCSKFEKISPIEFCGTEEYMLPERRYYYLSHRCIQHDEGFTMPPEYELVPKDWVPGPHIDIYGVGTMLYELLIGTKMPLIENGGLRERLSNFERIRLGVFSPEIDSLSDEARRRIADLIESATHYDYTKRPQTASEMISQIAKIEEGIALPSQGSFLQQNYQNFLRQCEEKRALRDQSKTDENLTCEDTNDGCWNSEPRDLTKIFID